MKYSVGQKVKIHSLEWYQDNVNRYGIIECGKYEFFEPMNEYCGKVVTIKRIDDDNYRIDIDKGAFCWTDEMIEGLVEEKVSLKLTGKAIKNNEMVVSVSEYILPEGYIIKDENGNVINTNKIVLEKKKEYPKTYEECREILKEQADVTYGYKKDVLHSFQKLLICRDAYWKLYGDEMGLGKPWEPDYDSGVNKYGIICMNGVIQKSNPTTNWERHLNKVLDFPTEEMRDAFYENFEVEIKSCKELL